MMAMKSRKLNKFVINNTFLSLTLCYSSCAAQKPFSPTEARRLIGLGLAFAGDSLNHRHIVRKCSAFFRTSYLSKLPTTTLASTLFESYSLTTPHSLLHSTNRIGNKFQRNRIFAKLSASVRALAGRREGGKLPLIFLKRRK